MIVSFFQPLLLIGGGHWHGEVTFLADDSAALYVNGDLIFPEAPPNPYAACSDIPVGCLVSTEATVGFDLHPGLNLLRFDVAQRNGVSFGLNYAGTASNECPEPAGIAMVAVGLLLLAVSPVGHALASLLLLAVSRRLRE